MTHTLTLGPRIRAPFSKRMQQAMLLAIAFMTIPPLMHFCGDDGNIEAPRPDAGARPIDGGNDAAVDAGEDAGSDSGIDTMPNGRVFFVEPVHGAQTRPPLHVVLGSKDFSIEPADGSSSMDRGHFHLIVNQGCLAPGTKMIVDTQHLDFANGETEAWIEMNVGAYELCLQAADGNHVTLEDSHRIQVEIVR